jgi:hypothetical protein
LINFCVWRSGEAIEEEGVEDEDISKEDEIAEAFEGLEKDDDFFCGTSSARYPKMHYGLLVMLARGGSVVHV